MERCIQLTDTDGIGKPPLRTPTRAPYPIPSAASLMWVAFESTLRCLMPVGRISAEPSTSTASRPPPIPLNRPSAPSTIGAGTTPLKLVGTGDWVERPHRVDRGVAGLRGAWERDVVALRLLRDERRRAQHDHDCQH